MRFNVGEDVEVIQTINLEPLTILRKGEIGRVVNVDPDVFGEVGVFVKMRTLHPELKDNTALLVAPETAYLGVRQHWFRQAFAWFTGGGLAALGVMKVAQATVVGSGTVHLLHSLITGGL